MVPHVPVLREEWLALCPPQATSRLLDVTIGHGGHAQAFLEAQADTTVVGFDADPAALAVAAAQLAAYGDRVQLHRANFVQMKDSVTGGGILHSAARPTGGAPEQSFSHVLFDLGIGSHQLADHTRGFSFTEGNALSMRYGEATRLPPANLAPLNMLTARLGAYPDTQDIVRGLSATDLADVLYHYGEERYSHRIAVALKDALAGVAPSAQTVAEAITAAVPTSYEHGRIHPATRTFQALRLAVNRELEVLQAALPQAVELLQPGGYLAVISFHSLEDRIAKQFLRGAKPHLVVLTKKPVRASRAEVLRNPRARSAKLRVAQRAPT